MRSALIVDDKLLNRRVLMSILKDEYSFIEASDGSEALDIVNNRASEICIILLNIVMPGIDGFGFMRIFNEMDVHEDIPVVMITGGTDDKWETEGFKLGAADYIHTPFRRDAVRSRVRNIVNLFEKQRELKVQRDQMRGANERITAVMASLVEFRDLGTGMHVQRVREITRIMMESLRKLYPMYGVTEEVVNEVTLASILHDIGKIAIPDSILLKKGKLTHEEYEVIKTHTCIGAEIIDSIGNGGNVGDYFAYCRDICLHHHERYDGSGYPDGLKGEENSIFTQLVSIADVYEALTDDRPYRGRLLHEDAVDMIRAGDCGAFSPILMDCFDNALPRLAQISAEKQAEVFWDLHDVQDIQD